MCSSMGFDNYIVIYLPPQWEQFHHPPKFSQDISLQSTSPCISNPQQPQSVICLQFCLFLNVTELESYSLQTTSLASFIQQNVYIFKHPPASVLVEAFLPCKEERTIPTFSSKANSDIRSFKITCYIFELWPSVYLNL